MRFPHGRTHTQPTGTGLRLFKHPLALVGMLTVGYGLWMAWIIIRLQFPRLNIRASILRFFMQPELEQKAHEAGPVRASKISPPRKLTPVT
jgi:hypothetical protein